MRPTYINLFLYIPCQSEKSGCTTQLHAEKQITKLRQLERLEHKNFLTYIYTENTAFFDDVLQSNCCVTKGAADLVPKTTENVAEQHRSKTETFYEAYGANELKARRKPS